MLMRIFVKKIIVITFFICASSLKCMENDSPSFFTTLSTQLSKKISKELNRPGYLNSKESIELYKELRERIKKGNLKKSKSDIGLLKLQTRVAERSWTAQKLIAEELQKGDINKIMALAKEHKDILPPLTMLLVEQIRTEELADIQQQQKELGEFTRSGQPAPEEEKKSRSSYLSSIILR